MERHEPMMVITESIFDSCRIAKSCDTVVSMTERRVFARAGFPDIHGLCTWTVKDEAMYTRQFYIDFEIYFTWQDMTI